MLKFIEDLGMRFPTPESKQKVRYGIYKCSCGFVSEFKTYDIIRGRIESCKPCRVHDNTKHKGCGTRLYRIWMAMKTRCYNKKAINYMDYGRRGIKICKKWEHDFANFKKWSLKNGYGDDLSIDREKNNKNYKPSNCRWVKKEVQARNTRRIMSTNKSGYRGVSFHKKSKRWASGISINNKSKHLGLFNTPLEGAKAYDKYVISNNLEHTINGVLDVL